MFNGPKHMQSPVHKHQFNFISSPKDVFTKQPVISYALVTNRKMAVHIKTDPN